MPDPQVDLISMAKGFAGSRAKVLPVSGGLIDMAKQFSKGEASTSAAPAVNTDKVARMGPEPEVSPAAKGMWEGFGQHVVGSMKDLVDIPRELIHPTGPEGQPFKGEPAGEAALAKPLDKASDYLGETLQAGQHRIEHLPATGRIAATGTELAAPFLMGGRSGPEQGREMVGAMHRIFTPEVAAASHLQKNARNLEESVSNLEKNIALSRSTGVPVSTGQAAQDPGLAVFERKSRRDADSAAALFPREQQRIAAEELERVTGKAPVSLEQLGESLDARRKAVIQQVGTKVDEAYADLEKALPESTVHIPNSIPRMFTAIHGKPLTEEAAKLRKFIPPSDFEKLTNQVLGEIKHPTTLGDLKAIKNKYYDAAEEATRAGKNNLAAAYKIVSKAFNDEYEGAYRAVSPKLLTKAKTLASTEFKYRNILKDSLGQAHRDVNDAAKYAGRFMDSMKNARGMDTQAFKLMWNKAPVSMKRDVMNYYFHQAIDPRTGELNRNTLVRQIKTLAPEVRAEFNKFAPGHLEKIENIAKILDLEDFVQKVGKMPGSDTAYKLREGAGHMAGGVLGRLMGATGHYMSVGAQSAWSFITNQKMRSSILEEALINPEYAKALLEKTLTSAGQETIYKGTAAAASRALLKAK